MNYELVISICAITISVISLVASIVFSLGAREHNRKSVFPYPYLRNANYEDRLCVSLYNQGTGPMIVRSVTTHHRGRSGHLSDLVPPPPQGYLFTNYAQFNMERAIMPGQCVALLDAHIDTGNAQHVAYRAQLRSFLTDCTVTVEYTNVYRTKFEPFESHCQWFGRLEDEDDLARSQID